MQKCQSIRAKTSIERGVNASDHRCELLPMAMWGRMPLPPIHIQPSFYFRSFLQRQRLSYDSHRPSTLYLRGTQGGWHSLTARGWAWLAETRETEHGGEARRTPVAAARRRAGRTRPPQC